MALKMKGFPMMDTSSKHGTNANYDKSGPPFNILDPLGLAKKAKNFLGGNKDCPPPPTQQVIGAAKPAEPVTPAAPAAPAPAPAPAPAAAPEEAVPTMMKKGLMNGAPKLVGKQKNIDKNKNGKIDAGDFKAMKNGPTKKSKY